MKFLLRIAAVIDVLNTMIGRWTTWLILFCTLISALAATLRYATKALVATLHYVPDWHLNALLESQWFMFGLVFLFCAAWTLREGGHVRIDILYTKLPPVARIWIDIIGGLLFLLPVCVLIAYDSWSFFLISYQTGEASSNPGGLIWWPIKLAIPIAFILLSLQGLSETIKNIAVLTGHRPMPHFKGGH